MPIWFTFMQYSVQNPVLPMTTCLVIGGILTRTCYAYSTELYKLYFSKSQINNNYNSFEKVGRYIQFAKVISHQVHAPKIRSSLVTGSFGYRAISLVCNKHNHMGTMPIRRGTILALVSIYSARLPRSARRRLETIRWTRYVQKNRILLTLQ